MARENQGLQIGLIISVSLTIVLGGLTYYFYRQYEEADAKGKTYLTDKQKQESSAREKEADVASLKKWLGVPDTERVDTLVKDTFPKDMNRFGASYPDEVRFYHPLLEKMQNTIDEKNSALADAKTKIQQLDQQIKIFEASKQPQIEEFKKARDKAGEDLTSEQAKFKAARERIEQDQAKLQVDVQNVRKDKDAEKAKADAQATQDNGRIAKLIRTTETQADKIAEVTATKISVFDGEVRMVDQRLGKVWINRGRADALPRQITFAVYPADVTDMAASVKKASIEVTQVLGDHLSEARVLYDAITDPIVPGDKINTPLWSPGEKKHFALTGVMDVYGDGKNSLQTVMDLIKLNDGVVDAYIDDKTNQVVGTMSVNTRYLVQGDLPTEKGLSAQIDAHTKMTEDAKHFGIQKLSLSDMLQDMGWRNPTPVAHFGRDANPKDFAPKPPEEGLKKSMGQVSDVFKKREPPGKAKTSAY